MNPGPLRKDRAGRGPQKAGAAFNPDRLQVSGEKDTRKWRVQPSGNDKQERESLGEG